MYTNRGLVSIYFSRRHWAAWGVAILLSAFVSFSASYAQSPAPVLTEHNDNNRTGANLGETMLTPESVTPSTFGKRWIMIVKGRIYAQPLYAPNVLFAGKPHNMVFIATALNNIYAECADTNKLYWSVNLGTPVPSSDFNNSEGAYTDIYPDIGILSTPVIDQSNNTLYCVVYTTDGTNHHYFLHALNLSTGAERTGSPVEITGSVPGAGPGSVGGVMTFNAFNELQRPGLLLSNGVLYIAFGGHQENPICHGWIFAFSEATLSQIAEFCSTPNGATGLGSFWASGQGPAADSSGDVFVATGNGSYSCISGGSDYAMTVLKLQLTANSLLPSDFFTPANVKQENILDDDIGVCGPVLIPGTTMLLQGGKDGHFYLINTSDLGQYSKTNNGDILQDFVATANKIHGSPVYRHGDNGDYVYVWSQNDYLKQFQLADGLVNTTPVAESSMQAPRSTPGGMLSISANGSVPGTGIVWTLSSYTQSGYNNLIVGVLRAFDADNVGKELWNSQMNAARDQLGFVAKFVPPLVANGRVYAASDSGQVTVYGLLPGS